MSTLSSCSRYGHCRLWVPEIDKCAQIFEASSAVATSSLDATVRYTQLITKCCLAACTRLVKPLSAVCQTSHVKGLVLCSIPVFTLLPCTFCTAGLTTDRKAGCQRLKVQAPAPQAVPVGRMSSAATNALRRVLTQAPKAARSVHTSSVRAVGQGHSTGVSSAARGSKTSIFL